MCAHRQKNKKFMAFSLAEMLVALAILSMLILATTNILVQVSKIKMEAEIRAEISDSLQHTIVTLKGYLIESNYMEVDCSGDSCTFGTDAPTVYLDNDNSRIVLSTPVEGGGEELEYLTSEEVEVTEIVFNQVDDYVFMLFKARDEGGKLISDEELVVVQGSIVIRNEQ